MSKILSRYRIIKEISILYRIDHTILMVPIPNPSRVPKNTQLIKVLLVPKGNLKLGKLIC